MKTIDHSNKRVKHDAFWLFEIGHCCFAIIDGEWYTMAWNQKGFTIKPCDGRTLWGRVKREGMIEKYKKYKSEHSDQKFSNTEFI